MADRLLADQQTAQLLRALAGVPLGRLEAGQSPAPGTTADAHAWRASGLSQHYEGVTVLGDGAYLNCGMAVPHRKRHGRALLQAEEDDNAERRRARARVEHVIGRMKNYKILRDCRQRGDGLHHAVQAVTHMHKLALTPRAEEPVTRSDLPVLSLVRHPLGAEGQGTEDEAEHHACNRKAHGQSGVRLLPLHRES